MMLRVQPEKYLYKVSKFCPLRRVAFQHDEALIDDDLGSDYNTGDDDDLSDDNSHDNSTDRLYRVSDNLEFEFEEGALLVDDKLETIEVKWFNVKRSGNSISIIKKKISLNLYIGRLIILFIVCFQPC